VGVLDALAKAAKLARAAKAAEALRAAEQGPAIAARVGAPEVAGVSTRLGPDGYPLRSPSFYQETEAQRTSRLNAEVERQRAREAYQQTRQEAINRAAKEMSEQATAGAPLEQPIPHFNPYTGQGTLPGIDPLTAEQEKLKAAARMQALRKDTEFGGEMYDEDRARAAVNAFLGGAKENPNLFLYGTAPPEHLSSMEDIADYYSKQSGLKINVDYGASGDEPYKIKVPKTHGTGEIMLDRHGEPKLMFHEAGDSPMYDERGNVKKVEKEKELVGPPEEDAPVYPPGLWGTKEVPKEARGGELVYDEDGNIMYEKSRGGEQMRNERGRPKYKEIDNPDYNDEEAYEISVPAKHSSATYVPGTGSVTSTEGGSSGGGQLIYQAIHSHALRNDIPLSTTSGLSPVNQQRLLANVLSTIARHGENPRSVGSTLSGERPRARGRAGGFDVWNAETGETEARLKSPDYAARGINVNPRDLEFDGENFLFRGEPVTGEQIEKLVPTALSPRFKTSGIGAKTLQRSAVMRYLENATPDEARRVAQNWSPNLGPIFSGVGAGAIGLGALGSGLQDYQGTD